MTCKCLHRWIYFFSLSPVFFDAFDRKEKRKKKENDSRLTCLRDDLKVKE